MRYGFIHALYQNVLYERVYLSRRIQLHRRIGENAEQLFGHRARENAAELAMHFERGTSYWSAAKYHQQAAENAIRKFAYREAVRLSRRGLELLGRLPDTPERARQELSLQLTLGMPVTATEGYAAADAGSAYIRARELCRSLDGAPQIQICQAMWGVWSFYLVRAELRCACEIAKEFLQLEKRQPYPEQAMEVTLIHLGEFSPAIEHFEKAVALYDPELHHDDAFRYSQNSAVATRCHAAWALWFLGRPDQALDRISEAWTLALELSEPHGMAHVLFFAAVLYQLRRDPCKAQEHAQAAVDLAVEHGLLLYQAIATVVSGSALMQLGQQEEAIEQILRGFAAYHATGTELLRPYFLALLAETLGKAGRTDEGLCLLEEALAVTDRNSEHFYESELYRLRGELLLQQSMAQDAFRNAESCFRQAIGIADKQQARSLELRAAMSIARLCEKQDRREEAQRILSRTYEKFAEGFDTMDLLEAKALLGRIS